MKVLLVEPPQLFLEGGGLTRQVLPLGLGYLGAVLAPEHDVRLLLPDTRVHRGDDPWGELRRAIAAEAPGLVGLTITTPLLGAAARTAALAKEVDPDLPVVAGGVHVTADPEGTLRAAPAVDVAVVGEGEETLAELVRAAGRPGGVAAAGLAGIPGLCLRGPDGAPVRTAPRPPPADLDRLPFPLRDRLVWPQDVGSGFYTGLVASRGCPFDCIYCALPGVSGRRVRFRSPAGVVAEADHLRDRFGAGSLFFNDPVFTLDRAWLRSLCALLAARRPVAAFSCQTRADRFGDEVADLLAGAGCRHVLFGIESGDEETRRRMGKGMPERTLRDAIGAARSRGMRTTGFFMVGFPWETEDRMRASIDAALSLDLDAVTLHSVAPLPGSRLWAEAGGRAVTLSPDFRTPAVNLTGMPDPAYRALFEALRARMDAYNVARLSTASPPAYSP